MSIIQALLSGVKLPIQFVTGAIGSGLTFDGKTSVTIPAHNPGDFLVIYGSSLSPTPPSFTSAGWTQIIASSLAGYPAAMTSAYKIGSGVSETVTFFGGNWFNTNQTDFYSGCLIFRNVFSIGATNSIVSSAAGTSIPIQPLSLTNTTGSSAVCTFVRRPYITSTTNGMTINNGMAYKLNNTSFTGGTAATSQSMYQISHSIELVN